MPIVNDDKLKMRMLVSDYIWWSATRKFYAPAPIKTLLEDLVYKLNGTTPPDAPNFPLAAAFNQVLHHAKDNKDERLDAFLGVYFSPYGAKNIKTVAEDRQVKQYSLYYMAANAATEYYSKAQTMADFHLSMQREITGYTL